MYAVKNNTKCHTTKCYTMSNDSDIGKSYGKSVRSARSSNESDITLEHKRQNTIFTKKNDCSELESNSDSSSDCVGEIDINTPKISCVFYGDCRSLYQYLCIQIHYS